MAIIVNPPSADSVETQSNQYLKKTWSLSLND